MALGSGYADDASLEEVEFAASVYLTFDELGLRGLAFGLSAGPRGRDGGANGRLVFGDAVGE